jgi:cytochrome P450
MNAPVNYDPQHEAWTMPLHTVDPANPTRFFAGAELPYLARLRRDAPIHYTAESPMFGPYWSITKYNDIMEVELNTEVFSSSWAHGGITVRDRPKELRIPMFIAMDPPEHDDQRKVVQPIVAPFNLAKCEALIRERTNMVLDTIPKRETFDWVPTVSVELTTMMLATLFDFPFEDRRLLTHWSDCATMPLEANGFVKSEEHREQIFGELLGYFTKLWNERVNAPPRGDLVSMLAHGEATRNMSPREYLGNLILLIVGGNDTTRNSMSGGVLFMHENPGEWQKLRANPKLVDSAVSEIIRYQTPLAHMRRTATRDFDFKGHQIKEGDKVVMWYLSANRDDSVIESPEAFIVDRKRPRQHISFGFGIHRCVGNRLAELQLKILWEEVLKRFERIEVVGAPQRVFSSFVRGYSSLPVRAIPK